MFTSTTKKRSFDQKQITRNLGKSERILDHRDLRKQMVILTRASLVIVIAVMHMLPPHILPHPGRVVVELGDAFIKLRHATPLRHVARRRRRRRQAPGRRERRPAKSQVSPRHSSCRNLRNFSRNRTARLGHRRRQRGKPRGAEENNLHAAPNANFCHSHGKQTAAKPSASAGHGYSARKALHRALCIATYYDIISVRSILTIISGDDSRNERYSNGMFIISSTFTGILPTSEALKGAVNQRWPSSFPSTAQRRGFKT